MGFSLGRTLAAFVMVWALSGASAQAATIIDLSSSDSGTANGAIYEWTNFTSTGTGVVDTYVRVQAIGTEQGYNHSLGGNVPWDTKGGVHTHDLQYQDLVMRTVLGVDYFEFLLDVNEADNVGNRLISLDNVQIFTRDSPITSADESLSGLGELRFNNDVGPNGDVTVIIDYSRNPGSGAGDMFLLVPVSLFAGTMPEEYVYFYSAFGGMHASGAGGEEWSVREDSINMAPVPEPGSMMLLGSGLLFAIRKFRRA